MNKLYIRCIYKLIKIYVELNRKNKYTTKSLHNLDLTLESCKGNPVAVTCC